MRMMIDVRPNGKGVEIETRKMVGQKDKVRIINVANGLYDAINQGILKGYKIEGVKLNLFKQSGVFNKMIEVMESKKNEEKDGGKKNS